MNAIIQIASTNIRNINGLYSLNDLHKASGGENRHKPNLWTSNQQTIDFIKECEIAGNPAILKKQGLGTFVCKELVIHYAMWISPSFSLQVIQHFLNSASTTPAKTTPSQREPLRAAVSYLVGKRNIPFNEAYRLVHQRFAVSSIDELPLEYITEAVHYVHSLAIDTALSGEVLDALADKQPEIDCRPMTVLCDYAVRLSAWFEHYYPALQLLNPRMTAGVYDYFNEIPAHAHFLADQFGFETKSMRDFAFYPWDGNVHQQRTWFYR